eukprot:scaffold2214_cov139-Cylindrotheca_fusiformis.AAC.30
MPRSDYSMLRATFHHDSNRAGVRCGGGSRSNGAEEQERHVKSHLAETKGFAFSTRAFSQNQNTTIHATMKLSFVHLLILQAAQAFHPVQRKQPTHQIQSMKNEDDPHDIVTSSSSTFRDIDVDMDRAKDCAEHFGMCSVKELKQLKKDLHDKRIQSLAFSNSEAPEGIFEEKVFEEEISLQLNLLQDEAPPNYLFPEVEDEMDALPHLKDGTISAKAKKEIEKERNLMVMEELAEEGVLESIAICGLLGMMMLAPTLLGA